MNWMPAGLFVLLLAQASTSAHALQTEADLEARVAALGKQLRFQNDAEFKTYERAIASGGVKELQTLLVRFTEAVLNSAPDSASLAIRARLQRAYSPWTPTPNETEPYTAATPQVFRNSVRGRSIVMVSCRASYAIASEGRAVVAPAYLNWDHPGVPPGLRRAELPPGHSLLVLDEIHQYRDCRDRYDGRR